MTRVSKRLTVDVKKIDPARRQVFGWASVSTRDGQPVIDRQNEYVPIDVIEKAATAYMRKSRDGSDMHERRGVATCIELMTFSKAKQDALGIDLGMEGLWVGMQILDDSVWAKVRDGARLPTFSIGGAGVTKEFAQ
jgi:hypothetical protein